MTGVPQPRPLPGAPEYFLRVYDTGTTPLVEEGMLAGEAVAFITPEFHDLHIYGYCSRSTYAEDGPLERDALARGSFPTMSFSVVTPEGEYGFQPVNECRPISRDQFEAARARGWQPPSYSTPGAPIGDPSA